MVCKLIQNWFIKIAEIILGAQDSRKITSETHIGQCWSCIGVIKIARYVQDKTVIALREPTRAISSSLRATLGISRALPGRNFEENIFNLKLVSCIALLLQRVLE